MQQFIESLNSRFKESGAKELLSWFLQEYRGRIAFSTSLGAEDQVITHMISTLPGKLFIFTLDTGRMFQETYDLIEVTRKKYHCNIQVCFPDAAGVEEMVKTRGVNLFYESVENRKRCCHVRKIQPLTRALQGMKVWITGLRREQSITRSDTPLVEWETEMDLIKVNPLVNWSNDEVWDYISRFHVPVNELHRKGYPSIGCMPCTRPVAPGEDIRSGRWWWELPQFRECGIHRKSK